MISVELKKSSILASRQQFKKYDNLVRVGDTAVVAESPNKSVTVKSNDNTISLGTKLGVTAFTTAVIVSPPIAGYYIFGKTGLVLGVLAAVPLAIVGGLVMIPVWYANSYN